MKQLKISVDEVLIASFKDACAQSGLSMAAVLSGLMKGFIDGKKRIAVASGSRAPNYTTRRQRRAAISSIVLQLEQIKEHEESYRDNIPENLRESVVYERADELVSLLDEVLDLLSQV